MSRKIIKNSFIFVFGDIVNKAVPFFMLPILTRYLAPSDYGIIASFGAFVSFLTIFIGLSLHGAINVNFFKLNKETLRVYIVNALLILGGTVTIVFLLVLCFDNIISERLLLKKEWLYVSVLVALGQFITLMNTTLWIAEQNPKAYSIYQILQTLFTTFLSIVLIVGFGFGWEGQVIAISVGSIGFAMVSILFLKKRGYLTLEYNKHSIKELLKFGIPMIPHQLSGWIRTSGDKILLIAMVGSTSTGLFTVGYQVAMMMTVITTAFSKAWNPYLYKLLSEENNDMNKVKIVKMTYVYFLSIIVLCCILYLFSKVIFQYLLDDSFLDSLTFVFYILLANTFNGMYFMVSSYLFYTNNTHRLAKVTFSIALVHVLLSYFSIILYGAIGIVYSGLVSMFLIFICVWYLSHKVYPMPWLFWRYNVE